VTTAANSISAAQADTMLDRLVHNAHRITLSGESLRRRSVSPV
jgi:DNA replication protein DnaC